MNLNATKGARVIFKNTNSGYVYDQELAKKHLVSGCMYTVQLVDAHSFSSTLVVLNEVPGVYFNTVLFEDAKQKSSRKTKANR